MGSAKCLRHRRRKINWIDNRHRKYTMNQIVKKKFQRIVIAAIGAVSSLSAFAADDGLALLNGYVKKLNTLEASFVQTLEDANGQVLQRQDGVFAMQKPGKFNWHYQGPEGYEQYIVADGKKLWFHDVDLEEVTVKPLDEALGTAPIALLTSDEPLDRQFDITDLGQIGDHHMLQLESKVKDTDYGFALLAFNADKQLEIMQLRDPLGQVTSIEFSDAKLNGDIPTDRFVFTVPEGVHVTGQP